jgi:hypothetical protein
MRMIGEAVAPQAGDVMWFVPSEDDGAPAADDVVGPMVDRAASARARWLRWLAGIVAAAAAAAVIAPHWSDGPTAPAGAAPAAPADQAPLAGRQLIAMAPTPGGVYALIEYPSRLTVLDTPHPPPAAATPDNSVGLTLDPQDGRIWVLAEWHDTGSVWAYDLHTLARLSVVRVPSRIAAATAVGGRLWVATRRGVYLVDGSSAQAVLVPGSLPNTVAVASDPTRTHVVAATAGTPAWLFTIRLRDLAVARSRPLPGGHEPVLIDATGR